jgi:effector-binding domain-containing protein
MPPLRTRRAAALLALAWMAAAAPAWAQSPPAASPPTASSPATVPAAPAPPQSAPAKEPFGQEVVLPPRRIVFLKGEAKWDQAFATLVDAYKSVYGYLKEQGLQPAGKAMTIYTQADDTGFEFQAAVPIAADPKTPPKGDLQVGSAPAGKALKFVHRGSYDEMDTTYEAVTNYLDEKNIDSGDLFIEEYETDITQARPDHLLIDIYVPIK